MNSKTLRIEDEQGSTLKVFINSNNAIVLCSDDESIPFLIELNEVDAMALVDELNLLLKEL